MMSPAAPRSTASGLMMERVRCSVFMLGLSSFVIVAVCASLVEELAFRPAFQLYLFVASRLQPPAHGVWQPLVPSLKGLGSIMLAYPALKRWANLCRRYAA